MKSLISLLLLSSITVNIFGAYGYQGSTTAAVVLAGSIIKTKYVDESGRKYKRKDCPVCKGQGWYLSGDKIKKVDCGYCEPDSKHVELYHSPECSNNNCKIIKR